MAEPRAAAGEPPVHVELPDGVTIRSAHPRDAGSFLDLWRSVVAEGRSVRSERVRQRPSHYRRQFRHSWTETGAEIVAVSGERVVGHLSIRREDSPTTAHVATLGIAVAADHRGHGVGSALLAECLRWARGVGVHKVMLSVFPHNAQAIGLYRKFGFVQEGRLVAYSRKATGYEDELLMSVWLD